MSEFVKGISLADIVSIVEGAMGCVAERQVECSPAFQGWEGLS